LHFGGLYKDLELVYRAQLALFGKLFSGVRRGGSAAHFPRSFDHERDAEGFCQGALLVRS